MSLPASQEVILKPASFKFSWQKCYLMASKKENSFRMYTEKTKEFLLSAVQHGDDFYISKYEDFPQRFKEGQELKTSWALSTGQIGHTMSEFKEKLLSSVVSF